MEAPKMYNFNGRTATWGEVNQKAKAACSGAPDYSNKIARLEIGDAALQLKRFGTIQRIAYP